MRDKLRKRILSLRMQLPQEIVTVNSASIEETLLNLLPFKQAEVIMTYVDFRNEVKTDRIITAALNAGKRVAVPVSQVKTKKLIPAEIYNFPNDLQKGAYGILEPREIRPLVPEIIDLVIVPGVAFDIRGNRLGYGAGYYDRFLSLIRKDAISIALAFEMQIVENVYPQEHDVPVDYILTEKRLIKCNA